MNGTRPIVALAFASLSLPINMRVAFKILAVRGIVQIGSTPVR